MKTRFTSVMLAAALVLGSLGVTLTVSPAPASATPGMVATAAAMTGGGTATATPASAEDVSMSATCTTWGATGSPGDIAGAWAHGNKCRYDDGRVMIETWLKDTLSDGKAACVQVHAIYADGGTRDEWGYVGGFGVERKVGAWTFASSVRDIWVREGLGSGGVCTKMASGVHYIW